WLREFIPKLRCCMGKEVHLGFESQGLMVPIEDLLPLKQVKLSYKSNATYLKVLSSIREIGVVEPLAVFPQNGTGKYLLLDGHVRLEALKELGRTHAPCLVSTDDEAYNVQQTRQQNLADPGAHNDSEGYKERYSGGKDCQSSARGHRRDSAKTGPAQRDLQGS